ncbi:MAG TPA: 16S rRNA (uracil(1498)-N(3))-methyltransferase [Nitrospirota bacterium]
MPRPPRFFITPEQVSGLSIVVSGEDVRHIASVLRMKTGDELLLCDGAGTEYVAKIASLDRAEIRTEILSRSVSKSGFPSIILGQGLPKSDKMDLIVQKATELGVAGIVPLITERTIMKIRDEEKRLVRWKKIAREAAMQSNRPDIPFIEPIRSFQEFILSPHPGPLSLGPEVLASDPRILRILPWEEGTDPLKNVLRQNKGVGTVCILIGPEGGFSRAEAAWAQEQGFHAVSLGPTILRTETAAIAALSMIGYELFSPEERGCP